MIAYMQGALLESDDNSCIILTSGGVGYEVHLAAHTLADLPEKGAAVSFYIHTQAREDALELFGFETWDERETFRLLIGINRVGARTAMAVLGIFRPDDLRRIVREDNITGLTQVPGIGKKSGQQIFLELKYKLKLDILPTRAKTGGSAPSPLRDAVAALGNLGYSEDEAVSAVQEVLAKDPDMELGEILRAALKHMAKRKS